MARGNPTRDAGLEERWWWWWWWREGGSVGVPQKSRSLFLPAVPLGLLPRRAEGSGGVGGTEGGVGRSRGEGTRGCGGLCSGGGRGSGRLGERDLVFLVADSPFRSRSGGDFLLIFSLPGRARGGFPQDCPPTRPPAARIRVVGVRVEGNLRRSTRGWIGAWFWNFGNTLGLVLHICGTWEGDQRAGVHWIPQ